VNSRNAGIPIQPAGGGAVRRRASGLATSLGLWLALLALVAVAALASPDFLTPTNLLNIVRQASVVGVAAVGVTLVMIAGGVDLSVGAVISFAAPLAATIMAGQDANIPVAIAAVLGMGLAVGIANGTIIARLNVPPFILTLGMAAVVVGITQLYTGGAAAGVVAPGFRSIFNARIGPVSVLAIVFLMVVVVGLVIQRRTTLGRRIFLVGANPNAAFISGVPVSRTLVTVYAISGLTAALGGLALLARSGVSSNFAGQGYEFDVLAAVVLGGTTFRGGRGGIGGTVAGVLILVASFNLVNILGLNFNIQAVVKGVIIIAAAALYALGTRSEEAA
jgi:ribose/xylose/arabinose/galactoside ABC-type transport system permease subunit